MLKRCAAIMLAVLLGTGVITASAAEEESLTTEAVSVEETVQGQTAEEAETVMTETEASAADETEVTEPYGQEAAEGSEYINYEEVSEEETSEEGTAGSDILQEEISEEETAEAGSQDDVPEEDDPEGESPEEDDPEAENPDAQVSGTDSSEAETSEETEVSEASQDGSETENSGEENQAETPAADDTYAVNEPMTETEPSVEEASVSEEDTSEEDDPTAEDLEEAASEGPDSSETEEEAVSESSEDDEAIKEESSEELKSELAGADLEKGAEGNEVLKLQNALKSMGYLLASPDSIFGGWTETAVKKFQLYNNLAVTGIADGDTQQLLYSGTAKEFYNLSRGSSGSLVLYLQQELQKLGYLTVTPDGIYGSYTYAAVMRFQANNGLNADGIAGSWTFQALLSEPVPYSSDTQISTGLSKGDKGVEVLALQELLAEMGFLNVSADGVFGGYTERAVKKFQMYNNLEITGTVDETTCKTLVSADAVSFSNLSRGNSGQSVLGLQKVLAELGYLTVTPDGGFGNYTYNAVLHFQNANNLTSDGICGRYTAEKLFNDPVEYTASQDTSTAAVMARAKLDQVGWDLYAAYKWSAGINYTSSVTGYTTSTAAVFAFTNGYGDCVAKAASFYWMAKMLGYDCKVIYGQVPYARGGYGDHAWVEIVYNGSTYVCDPDFEWEEGRNGYMIYYGQSGTWRYVYGYILGD